MIPQYHNDLYIISYWILFPAEVGCLVLWHVNLSKVILCHIRIFIFIFILYRQFFITILLLFSWKSSAKFLAWKCLFLIEDNFFVFQKDIHFTVIILLHKHFGHSSVDELKEMDLGICFHSGLHSVTIGDLKSQVQS